VDLVAGAAARHFGEVFERRMEPVSAEQVA
jgi:hypothetical protein